MRRGRGVARDAAASGDEEAVHPLQLLLGQHQAVHALLAGGAGDGDAAHERGPAPLLLLGLEGDAALL